MSDEVPPRLELILTLPHSVGFHRDALGASFQTKIGHRAVTLTLPTFRFRDGRYRVVPPFMRSVRRDVQWDDYLDDRAWGYVSGYHTRPRRRIREAFISHILATVPIRPSERPARTEARAEGIAQGSHAWWEGIKDWIEASTALSLVANGPDDDQTLVMNTRAWAWTGKRGRNVSIDQSFMVYAGPVTQLRRGQFQAVLDQVAGGAGVPAMHLFLRDARLGLIRRQTRVAVLDAATAAELALNELLDARLQGIDAAVVSALRGRRHLEMGRLRGVITDLGQTLPATLQTGLIDVRNRAIHRGAEATVAEAAKAVSLAAEVVELVSPRAALLWKQPTSGPAHRRERRRDEAAQLAHR